MMTILNLISAEIDPLFRSWHLQADGSMVGWLSTTAVPGLPGIYDLDMEIVPQRRRHGLGSRFLKLALDELADGSVTQLTYAVDTLTTPAARFLQANGFHVSHTEVVLERATLTDLPPVSAEIHANLRTFSRRKAIATFLTLYDEIFATLAWYQPFSEGELAEELASAEDLLFLMDGSRPIGLAWLQQEGDLGRIEPFGIVADKQRQGLGRGFLIAALHRLAQRGATRASIGTWQINQPAIQLYRRLGFVPTETKPFLAIDL